MYGVFISIHVLICVGLMISVLMQSAKGEGLAGAFGGSALTGTVFGGRGAAPFLAKATSGLAVAFFLSCILLTFLSPTHQVATAGGQAESAVEKAARQRAGEMPVQQPGVIPTGQQTPPQQGGQQQTAPPSGQQQQQSAPPPGQTPPSSGQTKPGGQ